MDEYTLSISGIEHTMLLDAEDAEKLKATRVVPVVIEPGVEVVEEKSYTPANKSRAYEAKTKAPHAR